MNVRENRSETETEPPGDNHTDALIDILHNHISGRGTVYRPGHYRRLLQQELVRYTGIPVEYIKFDFISPDVISEIISNLLKPGDEAVLAAPCREDVSAAADMSGSYVINHCAESIHISDPDSLIGRVGKSTGLVYLANPNSVTGIVYSRWELERILKAINPTILLLDESSYEFSWITAVDLIMNYDNLAVIRQFPRLEDIQSIRNYYILGHQHILRHIGAKNVLSESDLDDAAAIAGLRSLAAYNRQARKIREIMLYLSTRLRSLGFHCLSASAGRLPVRVGRSYEVVEVLRNAGINAEDISGQPSMSGYISIFSESDYQSAEIVNIFRSLAAGESDTEIRMGRKLVPAENHDEKHNAKRANAPIH